MSSFYDRWRANEKRAQAYIDLPKYDKILQDMNDSGKPPIPVNLTIPFGWAVLNTVNTYLLHTFVGRRPIFQLGNYKMERMRDAENMETIVQYNADHNRLVRVINQWFMDAGLYGVGVLRTQWKREEQMRTRMQTVNSTNFLGSRFLGSNCARARGCLCMREMMSARLIRICFFLIRECRCMK
ncbi:MAG: hypothetical protein HC883_00615 [Bdellovibrionaceae bacterium]|nr:hypothetical protein [Pseudobdellovibrionaceae bacterium]